MGLPIDYSKILETEKTSVVSALVKMVEQQFVTIQQQAEIIQTLRDEIARLKGQKPKPNIRPSKLEKGRMGKKQSSSDKRPGSQKRKKTADLVIHETIPVPPELIPPGSIFKEYQPYTVQGIKLLPYNVCYLLERWQTPDGKNIVGKLPPNIQGHFSADLRTFILYQLSLIHISEPTRPY